MQALTSVARAVVAHLRLKLTMATCSHVQICSGKSGGGSFEIETNVKACMSMQLVGVARAVVAHLRLKHPM